METFDGLPPSIEFETLFLGVCGEALLAVLWLLLVR